VRVSQLRRIDTEHYAFLKLHNIRFFKISIFMYPKGHILARGVAGTRLNGNVPRNHRTSRRRAAP
jgi:hypothetical protein